MANLGDLGLALVQQTGALQQQMAQMNAHMRNQNPGGMEAINSFYAESRRFVKAFDEQRGLRYRPSSIQLAATIVGAGTANNGANDFRVSMNEDFIVHSIRTYINLNSIPTEPNGAGFAVPVTMTPMEIAKAKALNCNMLLLNKDTKVPIFENANLSFASLCPEVGGHAMTFSPDIVPGFIIPHNVTMQVQFNLASANAFFNTASTTYGIAMYGVYLSRDRY